MGSPRGFSINSSSESDVISESNTASSSTTNAHDPPASEVLSGSSSDGIVAFVDRPCSFWDVSSKKFKRAFAIDDHIHYLLIRKFTREVFQKRHVDIVPDILSDTTCRSVLKAVDDVCPGNRYTLMAQVYEEYPFLRTGKDDWGALWLLKETKRNLEKSEKERINRLQSENLPHRNQTAPPPQETMVSSSQPAIGDAAEVEGERPLAERQETIIGKNPVTEGVSGEVSPPLFPWYNPHADE